MTTTASKALETFPNPEPGRDYIIEIESPEFTCLCPKTGQPDFATLEIEYIPDRLCVELKSLKLYIWSFRDEGHFHEKVTNTILNDLVAATQPRYMRLRALFNVRGGITTTVTAEHRKPGWQPLFPPLPELARKKRGAVGAMPETAASTGTPAAVPAPVLAQRAAAQPAVSASAPPVVPAAAAAASAFAPSVPAPPARSPTAPPSPIDPVAEDVIAPHGLRSDRFRMLARKRGAGAPADAATAPAPAKLQRDIYVGIDIGTSGCRAVAIDEEAKLLAQTQAPLPAPMRFEGQVTQDPADWWKAASATLKQLLSEVDPARVRRIAVAGPSGTLLLCDKKGHPVTPALMYNDRRAEAEAERIAAVADEQSAAYDASGSLAKLLWLQGKKSQAKATYALHQADWISNRLIGNYGHSDYHNSLKLGYDAAAERWPPWFKSLDVPTTLLPHVNRPGEVIGTITAPLTESFGLPAGTEVVAGTTHGVAAFLAAGASKLGHGVTVLGSTLVLKLLSEKQIASRANGVYSHRLGRYWLVGGASNSGGAVLLQYFTVDQLNEMTPLLDPETPTELNYYPLTDVGERFPVNDPRMAPKLEPLPGDSLMFLQGILEGIARIEAQGYATLMELGGPKITAVWSTGSGSLNSAWTRIRERALGTRLHPARSHQAAFGAALLAAGILQKQYA